METQRQRERRELAEKRWREANERLAAAELAYRADPANPDLALAYAIAMVKAGKDLAESVRFLQETQNHSPDHPEIALQLADWYVREGRPEPEVRAAYERAIDLSPSNAEAMLAYASTLTRIYNQEEEAGVLFERAVEIYPQSGEAWYLLGAWLNGPFSDADPDPARVLACYERALQCGNIEADWIAIIADYVWEHLNDAVRAQGLFEQALALEPSSSVVLGSYAHFLQRALRDYAAADRLYVRLREQSPRGRFGAYHHYRLLTSKLGDWHRADEVFEAFIAVHPDSFIMRLARAQSLAYVLRDYDRAESAFREIRARFPGAESGRLAHAKFRMECLQDYAFAEAELRPLWEAREELGQVVEDWIRLLLETGREAEAVRLLTDGTVSSKAITQLRGLLTCLYVLRLDVGVDALAALRAGVHRYAQRFWFSRFEVLLERARAEGHPEMEWLPKLVQVLRDEEPASILDAWPAWRAAGERA